MLLLHVSNGNDVIMQKSAFLASEAGVELSIFVNKKLGAVFFWRRRVHHAKGIWQRYCICRIRWLRSGV